MLVPRPIGSRGAVNAVWLVLAGWALAIVMMTVLWLVQRATGDAGVVDVGWAAGLGVLAAFYAVFADGAVEQRVFVAVLAGVWSARLALYVYVNRIRGKGEDGRYRTLRARWGDRAQARFFVFFQAQGLLDVLMSLPFLVIASDARDGLSVWSVAAAALWVVAISGEALADRQLAAFRADLSNRGTVCREGLWRYSRHPNYFFEWLHWWVYVIAAVGAPWWPVTLISPALISFFLFRVTGIPATERQALESRGAAYAEYQRTTSVFVPWFPKKTHQGGNGL
jgi:steroid 5-alpha reductase family enzyme